ncbi:DUF4037 domain-containing protein [Actinospica durhamensis]|uniref:DUF4037 domain-containing protein n=1 Tax=Actinospica durhamensis TaxID=1508375 RepID=A0A941EHA3_9ACTN|nr:DUF4037 domain-containing protein [Actinospica durhamensis]MBR7832580.1 DUF4037 domain-containing protein [Actinospica durhamensis]
MSPSPPQPSHSPRPPAASPPVFIPGLELSRLFFAEVLAPLLDSEMPGLAYSAALLGWGSDVQGFDTQRSTDHAWGPRLQIFLSGEDHRAHAVTLDALFARELPAEFRGHPVRFAFPHGTAERHWVHIHDLHAYFSGHLLADPDEGLSATEWLMVPTQVLRELIGGEVFRDDSGLLGSYRRALAWYPDEVWRYILACQWTRLSDEEAFVGRCGEVGDELGSAVVAARQVRDLMRLCLLMSRVYPPYGKWLGTVFASLPCSRTLGPILADALGAREWKERERHLSAAYEFVGALHNELGLTEPVDAHVRDYHNRPFEVLHAERFAQALLATIPDPAVRGLPLVGAIDQYVDSTAMTDHNHVAVRSGYIAGPGSPA